MPPRAQRSLAAIFVVVAAVCAGLGKWQLDRLHERRAANIVAAAKRSLSPVTLGLGPRPVDSALAGRRVAAVGRYDHDHELVVRGQVFGGVPGVHVITPLVFAGGDTAVLVSRGFLPSPDARTAPQLDSLREPGTVRVDGIALAIERNGRGQPISRDGHTSWGRLDLDALRDSIPYELLAVVVRRAEPPGERAVPRALPAPPLGDGPHLSYALQWFGFMLVALVFAGVTWRKQRQ